MVKDTYLELAAEKDFDRALGLLELARATADRILAGTVTPIEGMRSIHTDAVDALGHPQALQAWCGFDHGLVMVDDAYVEIDGPALDRAIVDEARRLREADLNELAQRVCARGSLSARLKADMRDAVRDAALALATALRLPATWIRHAVRGSTGVAERRPTLRRATLRSASLVLQAAGVAVGLAGIAIIAAGIVALKPWVCFFVPIPVWLGHRLFAIGRSLGARTAAEVLAEDTERPPILYLRSFADDRAAEGPDGGGLGQFDVRDEEALAGIFGLLGPFVAIGDPADVLPRAGAARVYLRGDDWQDNVTRLMAAAGLVILRVGDTPGFLWEARVAMRTLPRERVLFYFSQHHDAIRLRQADRFLRDSLGADLPAVEPAEIDGHRFLGFDAGGKPIRFGRIAGSPGRISAWLAPLSVAATRVYWQGTLAEALRPYLLARGWLDPKLTLVGRTATAVAVGLGGPLAVGLLLARDFRVLQRPRAGWWALVGCLLVGAALLAASSAGAAALLDFFTGAQVHGGREVVVLALLAAFSVFVGYLLLVTAGTKLCLAVRGPVLRRHLGLGGTRMPASQYAPIVIVCGLVWWCTVALVAWRAVRDALPPT